MFFWILIILVVIVLVFIPYRQKEDYDSIKTFVSMTTIPERVEHPWFYENLKQTLTNLPTNSTLILNVPCYTMDNVPYIIPENVQQLQSSVFIIHFCDEDEGPITKINPTLRNSTIPDDSIIIIIDDDIVYNPNVFFDLQKSVITHPTKISSMCNKNIEGFSGYAFVKKTLKGLQDLLIPKSCIRIDDFVVSSYIDHFNIGKVSVPYQNIKHAFCSMNIEKTDEHPPWKELCSGEGETKEEGKHMKKKCSLDLNNSFLKYKHL